MADAKKRERIIAIDALRGIALILMGLVHTAAFVYANIQAETYGAQPAVLLSWPYWVSALFTTIAAPVFWVLSGTSVALLETGRRRAGESEIAISRFLIVRAGLLILLDLTIADWAWGGGGPYTHILLSLAISLMVLSVARWLPLKLLGILLLLVILGYQLALPWIAANLSQTPHFGKALFLGYRTQPWPAVEFSLLGWGPLMGVGYILGRHINQPFFKQTRSWLMIGAILITISFSLRAVGSFGDLVHYSPEQPWYYFLVMSKTPPSLTYLTLKLGIAAILMAVLVKNYSLLQNGLGQFFVICGQASLFFFIMHIVIYSMVSWAIMAMDMPGPGIVRAYTAWAAGLFILFPLTKWYRGVRRAHPRSILRYL